MHLDGYGVINNYGCQLLPLEEGKKDFQSKVHLVQNPLQESLPPAAIELSGENQTKELTWSTFCLLLFS